MAARPPTWNVFEGLTAGAATVVIIVAAGLIAGRMDVVLLALPLVAAVVLQWERRPDPAATTEARVTLEELSQTGDAAEVSYVISIDSPLGTEAVVLRYSLLGGEPHELVLTALAARELPGRVALLHSGPQELLRLDYRLLCTDAAIFSLPLPEIVVDRVISPQQVPIRSLPLPRRLQALTGSHESARAGDGGDFRDIHLFNPGDRLRRIDWKATARRSQPAGDLYVRRTSALADATVLIVMDSRDDVGEQIADWSTNTAALKGISSLDIAREAASSLAQAYIRAGDRVGFQDLSSRSRMIPHAGGRRHLWRLQRAIAITEPSAVPFRHQRAPIVPPGALVYVLSSFLDDQAPSLALVWRGAGHRVIAVDVLASARFARTTRYMRLAHRIVMMEREDRIRRLQSGGVEILAWQTRGAALSRQARLQLLSRPPRRGGRPEGTRQ
ncbi:MAG: DUF58 domain-containing protein [Solirubrobacteraceae bacterium]